jgi:hypothetical protein
MALILLWADSSILNIRLEKSSKKLVHDGHLQIYFYLLEIENYKKKGNTIQYLSQYSTNKL